MKLDIISDPGHAWCKVKISLLEKLGIAGEISPYSYCRGDYAYLEEDCDLSVFMKAAQNAGIQLAFRERISRERPSRVRNYASYNRARFA